MIVRELMSDFTLSNYSVIIVDQAYERTLQTDLIANLKEIQKVRNQPHYAIGKANANTTNPLKIVIMSATFYAENFSKSYHK